MDDLSKGSALRARPHTASGANAPPGGAGKASPWARDLAAAEISAVPHPGEFDQHYAALCAELNEMVTRYVVAQSKFGVSERGDLIPLMIALGAKLGRIVSTYSAPMTEGDAEGFLDAVKQSLTDQVREERAGAGAILRCPSAAPDSGEMDR